MCCFLCVVYLALQSIVSAPNLIFFPIRKGFFFVVFFFLLEWDSKRFSFFFLKIGIMDDVTWDSVNFTVEGTFEVRFFFLFFFYLCNFSFFFFLFFSESFGWWRNQGEPFFFLFFSFSFFFLMFFENRMRVLLEETRKFLIARSFSLPPFRFFLLLSPSSFCFSLLSHTSFFSHQVAPSSSYLAAIELRDYTEGTYDHFNVVFSSPSLFGLSSSPATTFEVYGLLLDSLFPSGVSTWTETGGDNVFMVDNG